MVMAVIMPPFMPDGQQGGIDFDQTGKATRRQSADPSA
jgi:hypothetical protein